MTAWKDSKMTRGKDLLAIWKDRLTLGKTDDTGKTANFAYHSQRKENTKGMGWMPFAGNKL